MPFNRYFIKLNHIDKNSLLEVWAQKYSSALFRYFQKRTPGHTDHDDLVQEVFTRLAQRADLANIENVEGYLFQCASSVLNDFGRRGIVRARSFHETFEESHHGVEGISLDRVLIGNESIELLIDALHELPEKTQHIFALYHFENFRYKDISIQLGIGLSTVEKHMAKANTHLLFRLEKIK